MRKLKQYLIEKKNEELKERKSIEDEEIKASMKGIYKLEKNKENEEHRMNVNRALNEDIIKLEAGLSINKVSIHLYKLIFTLILGH